MSDEQRIIKVLFRALAAETLEEAQVHIADAIELLGMGLIKTVTSDPRSPRPSPYTPTGLHRTKSPKPPGQRE